MYWDSEGDNEPVYSECSLVDFLFGYYKRWKSLALIKKLYFDTEKESKPITIQNNNTVIEEDINNIISSYRYDLTIVTDPENKRIIKETKVLRFDKENNLHTFGFLEKGELPNPKLIYEDKRGGSNDQVLFRIPVGVSLESTIREATKDEMLNEINSQIKRVKKLEDENKSLVDNNVSAALNFIIDTLNASDISYVDLKDSFQKSFPDIYSKHHSRINFCEDCGKYILANEREDEVYNKEYDDYFQTTYYCCPICGNTDLV